MSPNIPQEIINLIIDQVAFAYTDCEMRNAQARMDLAASQMPACGLDICFFVPLLRCISFLGGPPMPLNVRDPQARRNLHASGRLRRACGLGIHQFRTLRFVYLRRRQQLNGLLGLIRSPLCTINDHVFEIDIELSTLLASDMLVLASLSNLQSIWLQGSPFAHLTTLAMSFTLSIKNVGLLLDSPAHSFLPRHFSPPALRSLRIAQHRVGGCNAVYDWLSSAARPLQIDSIVIQNYGREYSVSLLSLLRNAGPSLEHLVINANRNSRDFDLHEPPLPDLDPYPGLQSFACSWSTEVFNKDTAMQAAEICTAIGQISSLCMRTIEITIDMDDPEDIGQLALQIIDLYLQRPIFAPCDSEIMRDWARESFPACFLRGIVQLRKPPPRSWRG
ncbi:hypothetical protein FIBSPDRAFT_853688 [Athelia psychrophila]|uniref:Uncharacterized protein n=1 Tax=Athelia psychrophila TaxID=1759441 RepID=A0A166QFQ9_9AGAM|nr:hypothetical protein FIBSPDRAFT_853688 [Fibularhizoctonia sp. CBS 109695]